MPVLVVGADTDLGEAIIAALSGRAGELRAFVTDAAVGSRFKDERAVKVAVGDVSDASHLGSASLNAFSAVLIGEAAVDGRERSFAADPVAVVASWAEAIGEAGVRRAIWVAPPGDLDYGPIQAAVPEFAAVNGDAADAVAEVVRLDEAARI